MLRIRESCLVVAKTHTPPPPPVQIAVAHHVEKKFIKPQEGIANSFQIAIDRPYWITSSFWLNFVYCYFFVQQLKSLPNAVQLWLYYFFFSLVSQHPINSYLLCLKCVLGLFSIIWLWENDLAGDSVVNWHQSLCPGHKSNNVFSLYSGRNMSSTESGHLILPYDFLCFFISAVFYQ